MRLSPRRVAAAAFITVLVLPVTPTWAGAAVQAAPKKTKPSVALKATPIVVFSPARVVVTADLRGGDDDFQDLYCATEEWDWGDDTVSKNTGDCDPYEAGKSTIKRRFMLDHVFQTSGDYRVQFRLKQKNKVILSGTTEVKVRPGIRDNSDMR